MKKLSLIIILIAVSLNSYADLGNCLVYQVEITLKNNSFVVGYFEIASYDEEAYLDSNGLNKYCSNEGMMQLIWMKIKRENYGPDYRPIDSPKFTLYKNIHYPNNFKRPAGYITQFAVVKEKDVVIIDTNNIKSVSFIGVKQNKRDWLQSEIVVASGIIIDALYLSKPINSYYQAYGGEDPNEYMSGFYVFSYNESLTKNELKQLVENYYNKSFDLSLNSTKYYKNFTTKLSEKEYKFDKNGFSKFIGNKKKVILNLRKELLLKKVVIVRVWDTC
ncbi:MAG: hypothetical protein COA97_01255 [Flavobacteriales bacterium]|nr:MAG: hypothetical protein COA97_01255 [Flavobacteriales bacterium]